jgi:hypothetical protein
MHEQWRQMRQMRSMIWSGVWSIWRAALSFQSLIQCSSAVSQVERGVCPLDRLSVLQRVADVLSVTVAELSGGNEDTPAGGRRRSTRSGWPLTGHLAIATVLGQGKPATVHTLEHLRRQHALIWDLIHGSRYAARSRCWPS